MSRSSVFVFDSSYPSAEVALRIDDTLPHVIVSDRTIEPPPGHCNLKLEVPISVAALRKNLRLLRDALSSADDVTCVVIAAPNARKGQFLWNMIYASCLCRNVILFDGVSFKSLAQSWRPILGAIVRVLGKSLVGPLKAKLHEEEIRCDLRPHPASASREERLFGLYTNVQTFSIPLDRVASKPKVDSIYGNYTRGWYLPMFSNRTQCYAVQTNRHSLRDISLHVEEVNGCAERFLFKDGKPLDYPYFLGRARRAASYEILTRNEVTNLKRGVDLLHYTSGYYHWLIEGVPRILDLIDDGIDFDEFPLVMPPLELFHRQILEVLGICPDTQVVTLMKGDWCHIDECIFPTANFPFGVPELDDPSGGPDGDLLRRIRRRLLDRISVLSPEDRRTSKRLYISRAQATKRKFTPETEAAVKRILEAEGFQTVYLENLPWVEQALLVAGAEHIVGLHGAGLTNILFGPPRSLIEFQNPLEPRPYFALMARELEIEYAYIVGSLRGESKNFDNVEINCEELTKVLGRLGKPDNFADPSASREVECQRPTLT